MAHLTREALLEASDLETREVDLPSIGGSVKVRSLPATYSNQASSEALELTTGRRGEQVARINTAKLEELQVLHGLVEPKLNSIEDARVFMTRCGKAAKKVVEAIDELSGIDKEALESAEQRFPVEPEGAGRNGMGDATPAGSQ